MAIEFTNKPIKWTNEGTAPSEDLKTNGFQAGYKPPAAVFNNQWHTTGKCIDELQTKLSSTDDKKVDKVTGKSLIDENVANAITYNSNYIISNNGIQVKSGSVYVASLQGDVMTDDIDETTKTPKMHCLSKKANSSDVLTKTNTTTFTPTDDYNPATKKYVDDNKIDIIDDLNTMSNVAALSANQGKVINDKITALPIKSLEGQTVQPTSDTSATANAGATIIGDMRNRVFTSSGIYSGNVATGHYAVALGACNNATGNYSIAGGIGNKATGGEAVALGQGNEASSSWSVALGGQNKASGNYAVAFGAGNTAEGNMAVACGYGSSATAGASFATGTGVKATGENSIAAGKSSQANGKYSVAMGYNARANESAVALGTSLKALDFQTKIGKYAKDGTAGVEADTTGDAFIIGGGYYTNNGTVSFTHINAFRVTYAGKAYGLSAYGSSGADYAEYFEWADGNPDSEDRRGRLVTLDGEKIRFATADDDYILGVVSANPCIEGDVYSDDWQGKYLTDVFGQRLTQIVHIPARYEEQEITDPETGETTTENVLIEDEHDAVQWVLNPDYDSEQEYISREDRKEWTSIGLMGKLVVIDDGTCEVNGYCKAGVNGIATKADDGYRVMARIDDTHIRVLVR